MAKIIRRLPTTLGVVDSLTYDGSRNATIGFSSIGEECLAKIWYSLHWVFPVQKIPSRRKRIFSVGNLFEEICLAELKKAGLDVFKINEDGIKEELTSKTQKQEVFRGITGHEKGKPDGRVLGVIEAPKTEHLLEIKTMSEKNFNAIKKVGVRQFDIKYYTQIQRLMKAMKLTRTLFVAINKNTCEYYMERVEYNKSFADQAERKEVMIITSDKPVDKAYPKGYFKCVNCAANSVCQHGAPPDKNCRTCDFSEMENGGKWICNKHEKELSYNEQWAGCEDWIVGWGLPDEEEI